MFQGAGLELGRLLVPYRGQVWSPSEELGRDLRLTGSPVAWMHGVAAKKRGREQLLYQSATAALQSTLKRSGLKQ